MGRDGSTALDVMREYERRTNSHDLGQLAPPIAEDATYWFSNGSYTGRAAVLAAIGETFETIQDETYSIADIEVVGEDSGLVVLRYAFHWSGRVDGSPRSEGAERTWSCAGMAEGSCFTNISARDHALDVGTGLGCFQHGRELIDQFGEIVRRHVVKEPHVDTPVSMHDPIPQARGLGPADVRMTLLHVSRHLRRGFAENREVPQHRLRAEVIITE